MTNEEAKKAAEARGLKPGTPAYTKFLRDLFLGRDSNKGTKDNMKKALSKSNTPKNQLQTLKGLLGNYVNNLDSAGQLDANTARLIQLILVNNGYDISFTDKQGKKRTGLNAIDGRLGNSSIEALKHYTALLKGAESTLYEDDFRKMHNGAMPTYNTVAGRSPEEARLLANMYYAYYANNPLIYAGLLNDKSLNLALQSLPYLSDEAMSLLSLLYIEPYVGQDGRVLNTPELAYLNMLGKRGLLLQQQWEQQNVNEAQNRAGLGMMLGVADLAGVGLRFSGIVANSLFGDLPYKEGGLKVTYRFNPVTRLMELVVVPDGQYTTVADVAGIENGAGRFATNVLTDPLFLMSLGPEFYSSIGENIKFNAPIFKSNYQTMKQFPARLAFGSDLDTAPIGVPLRYQGPISDLEAARMVKLVKGGNNYNVAVKPGKLNITTGQPGNPIGSKGGYGRSSYMLSSKIAPRLGVLSTGGQQAYELVTPATRTVPEPLPYYWNFLRPNMPYIMANPELSREYSRKNYVEELPGGNLNWNYLNNPDGSRTFIVTHPNTGEVLYSGPASNTLNLWRKGLLNGTMPAYYFDDLFSYKCGGSLKKRCKRK